MNECAGRVQGKDADAESDADIRLRLRSITALLAGDRVACCRKLPVWDLNLNPLVEEEQGSIL